MNVARRRRGRLVVVPFAVAFALAASLMPAAAQVPSNSERPLAVSVSPTPAPLAPGATGTIPFRVVNPGNAPVNVAVSGAVLQFGDDGRVNVAAGVDPLWQGRVTFPDALISVAGQGYVDSGINVVMPASIEPDLYFIGFLVTPEATTQGSVKVINQIGSFITVDVPGPRQRQLAATLEGPGFKFGSTIDASLRVQNIGHAQAQFWGEADTTSSPGGSTPTQQRIDKSLLPTGHARSVTVTGKPAWPIGFVHITTRVIYPDGTDASTREIVLTKRVLVVEPWLIVVVLVLAAASGAWWWRRRRRKRSGTVPWPSLSYRMRGSRP